MLKSALPAIEDARDLFEIPKGVVYLNCANMAPQLHAITKTGIDAVRQKEAPWKLTPADWFSGAEALRATAARLLDTEAGNVALVPAASYGLAIAAANLPVSAGQTILVLEEEFPSNFYVWQSLARRKSASLVTVRRSAAGWTDALERHINRDTAIVAVPNCHWTDGSRVDLERIGQRVREVCAALVVDASQSLGACPLNLARVKPDFLVAVGYKWLLGPYGLGYLYVAPRWQERGVPLEESWLTRRGSDNFARLIDYTDEYRPGARRFDMGEFPQFILAPMADTALRQVLMWGIERIQDTLRILTDRLAEGAAPSGYDVLPITQRCAHMIGLRHPHGIPRELPDCLKAAKIFVSIRGDSIRVAPHLYNSARDIDHFLDVLNEVRDSE